MSVAFGAASNIAGFAAAAAVTGSDLKSVLISVFRWQDSSAAGPTSVKFGGVEMSVAHSALARTAGQGSGTYRHLVVAVLPLDGETLVGSSLVVTGVTPGSIQQVYFTGASQTMTASSVTFGDVALTLDTSGSPYQMNVLSPSVTPSDTSAVLFGCVQMLSAIGNPQWNTVGKSLTITDPSTSPNPDLELAYSLSPGAGAFQFTWNVGAGLSTTTPDLVTQFGLVIPEHECCVHNSECVDEHGFQPMQTLAELRVRFLTLTGYAAQASNPPVAAKLLANEMLLGAQNFMYMKYPALRTRRFFRWQMQEGVRFYELGDNDEDPNCGFKFNPYKVIEWVGVKIPGGAWLPMAAGIPPEFYVTCCQPGIPQRFEIRQAIEVLPGPDSDDYELWIKGHFGLSRFTQDTDLTTIDSELVLLWAVANRKASQNSSDASNYANMAQSRLGDLVAGTHGKNRYVPGTVPVPPAAQPIFLPIAGAP